MVLKPINDKILIKPVKTEKNKTASGIFIPDTANDKPQIATVIAVGNGRLLENGEYSPLIVKDGDKIIYSKFAGTEIQLEDNEDVLLLITERDVLAIIKD